ncbi:MAG TPA: cation-translocating P-type ATPase C-terminal domain-containing protein, partial [Actinotalea sp.]|nr:cation-translocating P-type ATPase C-terminal domain-containing protein [Actinotalea sp.]
DPDVMSRPPRDPKLPITNRAAVTFWVLYGAVLFLAAFMPLVAGPDQPSTDAASVSMTMTFVVLGLGTVFNALTNRRDPTGGLVAPVLKAAGISIVPVAALFLATELPGLQGALMTVSLTGPQWLACIGLALLLPLVIEISKWVRRRRIPAAVAVDPQRALAPQRAFAGAAGLSAPRTVTSSR